MDVVDHAPAAWYLLADGDALLLDVNCNHGAIGYSVLIELDGSERARWQHDGHEYLDRLSQDVHTSAPLVDKTSRTDHVTSRGPDRARSRPPYDDGEASEAGRDTYVMARDGRPRRG